MMKELGIWLLAPWRGLLRRHLTRKWKAVLVGVVVSSGMIYGGRLLFHKEALLENRSVAAVLLIPGTKTVYADLDGVYTCRSSRENREGVPGKIGRTCIVSVHRTDALVVVGDEIRGFLSRAAVPGGVILSALVGVATGFHYWQRGARRDC